MSAKYFLDDMQDYEIDACLIGLENKQKDNWERSRFNAFVTANSNGAKLESPSDLISFPWEKTDDELVDFDEIEARREHLRKLNSQNNGRQGK